ncbi:host cell division inhibitor Icd-like protein [Pantoea sp. SOD02]|uniref:host cell division inhibitor Icd-like protein n=1 Tax=Pantoea sp. SOD02 TaxID=2970818 RepID=UPI0035BE991D
MQMINTAAVLSSCGKDSFIQNMLQKTLISVYSPRAIAKSVAGRGNPCNLTATLDALCVFFCVYVFEHLTFVQRFHCRCSNRVMVAQAGLTSVRPVSVRAGISTPVWATTSERGNSGGSVNRYLTEVAIMATVLTQTHSEFTFLFLAVRRADSSARPEPIRVNAYNERDARLQLITDFIICFAGRIPTSNYLEARA